MPRPASELTPRQVRELGRWQARLDRIEKDRGEARRGFAAWVRLVGPSAVARSLGITRSAMDQRLRAIEGKHRGE